jgi:hypothetical protein
LLDWTEAAQQRNIEVGLLVRSLRLAKQLTDHFDTLVGSGALAKISCLPVVQRMIAIDALLAGERRGFGECRGSVRPETGAKAGFRPKGAVFCAADSRKAMNRKRHEVP